MRQQNRFFTRALNMFRRRMDYESGVWPGGKEPYLNLVFHWTSEINFSQRYHRLSENLPFMGYSAAFAAHEVHRATHYCLCEPICSSETFKVCGFAPIRSAVQYQIEHLL